MYLCLCMWVLTQENICLQYGSSLVSIILMDSLMYTENIGRIDTVVLHSTSLVFKWCTVEYSYKESKIIETVYFLTKSQHALPHKPILKLKIVGKSCISIVNTISWKTPKILFQADPTKFLISENYSYYILKWTVFVFPLKNKINPSCR